MLCWALFTFLITFPWHAFSVAADRNEGSRHLETVRQARRLSDEGPQQQTAAGVGSQHTDPAAAAVGGSQWPAASRLDAWTKSYERRYFRFHDVQLHPGKLVFFRFEEDTELPPEELVLNRLVEGSTREVQVQLVNAAHRRHDLPTCNGWITQPTVLIAGTPFAKNLWDYVTAFMPLWDTAHQEGLLEVDRYLSASKPPSSEEAGLNLIHAFNETYDSYWGYWMDYLSPNQWSLDQVSGQCFTDITVAESSILQFVKLNDTAAFITPQQAALKAFQRWIFRVEAVHWRSQGVPPPEALVDSVPYKRPRIVLAARPAANHWGMPSRGMVNEQEVLDFIAAKFDVNVTRIIFGGRMEEAMAIMQQTDMLIGMHGAGLTHVLWMRPGSHMLQMIPYGWLIHPHWNPASTWLIRGKSFKQVARAVGASYSQWANQDPDSAFFHRSHFERPEDFQEHPTPDMPLPRDWNASLYWIHQSTRVGLESFMPVLEQAMAALNVPVSVSGSLASQ